MDTPPPTVWYAFPAAPAPGKTVCELNAIPDGSGRMFSFSGEGTSFRLLVLRSGERCYGYVNRCPHFGVALAQHDRQLILSAHEFVKCNTHYARFRWEDGYCDSGDCEGESLIPVPLEITEGQVRFGQIEWD